MRRAAPILVTTAAGLALLASFHTNPGPNATALSAAVTETTAPTTSTPSTSARRSPTTAPPPTVAPTRTVDGSVASTRFGPVQVRVTLQGRRILDVEPLQMPFDHARSNQISQEAAPLLRSEVLQAQSARIQLLSGASYTSEAYAQSLQSALDRAGL